MNEDTEESAPPAKPPAPTDRASLLTPGQRTAATVGVLLALVLSSLDQSVVGAAMPQISRDLDGLSLYTWVGTSYMVAGAVVIPIGGKLGDMFGRKLFLLCGIAGFMAASWLCGLSQGMGELIALRGLQGLFGGLLLSNCLTTLGEIHPPESRGKIQGLAGSLFGLSSVLGPPLGGWITDALDWRWIFYVNVPVGLVSLVVVAAALPMIRTDAVWRDIDFPGAVTLAAGIVPLLLGLSWAGEGHGWGEPIVWGPLLAGVVLLTLFGRVEARAAHPIVPFGLFRNRTFTVLIGTAFLSAFAMMGAVYLVPLMYQGVLGSSATSSGNLLAPMMLALVVTSMLAGRVVHQVPRYRYLFALPMAVAALALVLLTLVRPDTGVWVPVLSIVLVGAGLGTVLPLTTLVMQSALPMEQIGVGTSQIQFWRMLGGPVALAVLGAVMATRLDGHSAGTVRPEVLADALHPVFWIAAVVMALAVPVSLALREVPLRGAPEAPKPADADANRSAGASN
ncbi:DHA2 family efflux MFS transporter permease subunit [Streptomyces sp. NPDC058374]|uniref:DHA2 family efflux MFS transporter permease subunit n=1 Tax=unclassified Streptomyces TaxID=2593676 RepID=UPI0036607E89